MINIKCHHLVSVKNEYHDDTNIMFKPTAESVKSVYAALEDGKRHHVKINDISGTHVSIREQYVIRVQESYGTVLFVMSVNK